MIESKVIIMRTARERWNKEYSTGNANFPRLADKSPASAVDKFVTYLKEKGLLNNGKVLEVGCGLGRNVRWLKQQGFDSVGVDISDFAIKEAKKKG